MRKKLWVNHSLYPPLITWEKSENGEKIKSFFARLAKRLFRAPERRGKRIPRGA